MGKQKRQRTRPHKENPTGLPSVKDIEKEEGEEITNKNRESALQRVFEEIQSANVEEKLSGLQTIESMSCDSALAVQIAENEIAKMIGPLLFDKNGLIRAGSASALRHIADNGKAKAYESLLKDDIMTPLCTSLKQCYTEWQSKDENEKGKVSDEKEAFIQTVTLLWTLCEHNELAVKCCNQEGLVPILTKYFDVTVYGSEIATIVVQCLLSLSEDNPVAVKQLKESTDRLILLLNLDTNNDGNVSEIISLKTAISGLLVNLIHYTENNPINTICKVINVLSDTLAIDSKQLLSNLVSIIPHEKNAFSSSAKKKVQENRKIFGAQQQALEILANLCSEDQESDNESDLDNSDCETDGLDDICMDDKLYKTISSLPVEIVEIFNSCNIVKKVWDKTRIMDKDVIEILEQNVEGKAILKQIHTLNCRAYLCLNNLMSSLEIDELGGMENIYRMWMDIGAVVFTDINPNDIELLESATAAMRAAIQRLTQGKANIFNRLTVADVQPMLNGERQCPNPNVRVNLIRILGNLALILMNNDSPETQELTKFISTSLLDGCMSEPKIWIMAESLDTIMDVYAEDDSDQLAREIKLVEKLHAVVPVFKNKMRQQRKILGDNIAVVSTVNTNINRFIKYKEKRIKNL